MFDLVPRIGVWLQNLAVASEAISYAGRADHQPDLSQYDCRLIGYLPVSG
jgi:hypothetical protein